MMAALLLTAAPLRGAEEPTEVIRVPPWAGLEAPSALTAPAVFPPPGLDAPAAESAHACPPFAKGQWTLEVLSGMFFAPTGIGPTIPTFDYAPVNLRLGYIVIDPIWSGPMRGCGEVLLDVTAAPVTTGFGDVLGGPSILLRWNFVQPGWRLVPYTQAGAGFIFTDAHEDRTQMAIGQSFEFLLQAGAGARYLVNDRWALNAEFDFEHISNGGTNRRNWGVNALGGFVGVTYFFPRPH
jgi:hypothetical protein